MKFKLGLLIAVSMLVAVFAFSANAQLTELAPDSATGKYELTYSGALPYTNYVAVAVEGIYPEDYELDLSESDINIIYYNVFTSDADGDIAMELVPSVYTDATLFIGGDGFEKPVAACCLLKADAETVADFEIYTDKTEYYVEGIGTSAVYVRFNVEAKDSFGFDSDFPYEDAEISFVDYEGDLMSFLEGSRAIQLENTLPEGVYSFSVTYGGITKTANFTVKHVKSEAWQMTVRLNGEKVSIARISCMNDLEGISFDPEKVTIEIEIIDQYLDVMDLEYNLEITKSGSTTQDIVCDGTYDFVPTDKLNVDDTAEYVIEISSDGAKNFSKTVRIIITGISSYTGDALSLYRAIVTAKGYIQQIESGEIVISDQNGNDVHYTKSWTTQANVDNLVSAIAAGEEMLDKIDAGTVNSGQINTAKNTMNTAVSRFKIYEGNYKPIEKLQFAQTDYRLAKGKTQTIAVTSTPSKPSEKPVYYSENPEIATVNENTGYVSTKNIGETKIYAKNSDGSIIAYYNLTVYVPISSVKYKKPSITLIAGQNYIPEITILPEDHSDEMVYTTNNKKSVKIDENGKITALDKGSATITATSGSGKSTTMSVLVVEPELTVTSECIAKYGTQLALPVSITNGDGIDRMTLTVRYNTTVIKLNEAKDLGLASGYVGTVDDGSGTVVSTWENVVFENEDIGKLIEYHIEVLNDVQLREYNINFNIEAYTKDGDKIIWTSDSGITKVDVGEKDTYTVDVTSGKGGNAYGGGEFKFGEEASVRARPDSSYNFAYWLCGSDKVSTDAEYKFEVTGAVTLQAIFTAKTTGGGGGGGGGGGSGITPTTPQVTVKQVSPITASAASGVVAYGTSVTLSTTTIDAQIYYTLDGSTPTVASILYTEPIVLKSESTTISAVAVKSGMTSSNIARFTYRIEEFPEATPVVKKLREYAAHIKYAPVTGPYFRPNDDATRYEVLEMLNFLFEVSGGEPEAPEFSDVSDSYKTLVDAYAKAGVINGYLDGTFGGYKSITRAEFVKILSILLGMDVSGETAYDVSLSDISEHWAENNIKAFVAAGYIVGYPEGDFRPDKAITRTEVVTVLNRITGVQKVQPESQYFFDVEPSFWGYLDIMNAANIPAPSASADSKAIDGEAAAE